MNGNILRAIESLCDDIATSTNAEDNQKRANAILALAFGGTFTPEEIEEDYTEDDSVAGASRRRKRQMRYMSVSRGLRGLLRRLLRRSNP